MSCEIKVSGRDTCYGKPILGISKNNTCQKDVGDAIEDVALELIYTCLDCNSELYNKNDDHPNNPGYDLACPNCNAVYQVKGYGPGNHSQLTSDYVLKQAGDYNTIVRTMMRYKLRYVILFYDNNKEVVRSVLTGIVNVNDIVYVFGEKNKQCSIEFNDNYIVEYV